MITELLKLFRMRAEVYHNAKVCGDWVIREHILGQTCFHMPTESGCVLNVPGHQEQVLEAGELVVFPREIPHSMCPVKPLLGEQEHLPYSSARDKEGTGMLCGKIEFLHQGGGAIIDALPPVMVFKHSGQTPWLHQLRLMLIEESYHNARSLVIDRLTELVFVYALRHYVEHDCSSEMIPGRGESKVGVLALYGHPKLQRAIKEMHRAPERSWNLETLAATCGMSRTAMAESFRETSGWTTMQYLTWWRMQLAYSQLGRGDSVSQVAEAVGYKSEAAFSRAFKREFSLTAGEVRRAHIF